MEEKAEYVDIKLLNSAELRQHVHGSICHYLAPYEVKNGSVTGNMVLRKDLTIDSLSLMDLVSELEDHYDILFPLNILDLVQTVDQLTDTLVEIYKKRHVVLD